MSKIYKLVIGLLLLNCFNNSNASNNTITTDNKSDIYYVADSVVTFLNPFEKLTNMVNTIDAIITLDDYHINDKEVNTLVDINLCKRNFHNLVYPLNRESIKNNDLKVLYNFKDYQEHKREILSHWVKTILENYSSVDNNIEPKIETVFRYLTGNASIENKKLNNIITHVLNLPDNKKKNIFNYISQKFGAEIAILESSYYDKIKMLIEKYENVEKEIQDFKDKIDGEIYDDIMKKYKGNIGSIAIPAVQEDEDKMGKGFCRLFGGEILPYLDNLYKLLNCISCPSNK